MSIQQSVNQALQSGMYAAGIGKGLANQKKIIQHQEELDGEKLNKLKEMQKKANENLKMTREAKKEQQEEFTRKTSGAAQATSDPREFSERFKTEANKVNKTKSDYEKARQERKDIKSQIKDLKEGK